MYKASIYCKFQEITYTMSGKHDQAPQVLQLFISYSMYYTIMDIQCIITIPVTSNLKHYKVNSLLLSKVKVKL